jgi:hypothetical protein
MLYAYIYFTVCDDPDPCELRDAGLLSHPKECQLYYNCSLPVRRFKPWLGKHVMECTYPDVFDEKTLQCGDFLNVQCNSRETYDHACKYFIFFRHLHIFIIRCTRQTRKKSAYFVTFR